MRSCRNAAVAALASLLVLAGCSGESAPPEISPVTLTTTDSPNPGYTPGLDPEADVAAAIKTHEAYVEASNRLDVSDRETWDPVLDLLLDDYRASSVAIYEQMAADGESFNGSARILSAEPGEVYANILRLHVCTDFSELLLLDRSGTMIGKPTDYTVRSLNVVLEPVDDVNFPWRIGTFGESDEPCS